MKTRKADIRSIDCKIKVLNALITIAAVSICFFAKSRSTHLVLYIYLSSFAILVVKSVVLVLAIIKLKRFIDTIELFVNPNRGLMLVHCINTAIYMTVQLAATLLYHRKLHFKESGEEEQAAMLRAIFYFFLIFQGLFQVYNVIFIFYLLAK